ncbi:MAG: hypothetical protein AAF431_09860 [Pseudomonadota bacterium]
MTTLSSNKASSFPARSTGWLVNGIRLLAITGLLALGVGCSESAPEAQLEPGAEVRVEEASNPVSKVHVAFAGGGWRAHTAHSAWTIALLDQGRRKLKDAFTNVGTISSNSGGSWYSTMLMYSSDFVTDIQKMDAATTWTSTGWIGKQRQLFDNAGCNYAPDGIYLECVFDTYTNKSYTGGTYWKLMVEKLVYKNYNLGAAKLSDPHLSWAADKPLLLASTLLQNTVVLNEEDNRTNNHRYYQACQAPGTPTLKGDSGSSCSNGRPADVTPATFSSIPAKAKYLPSPFFAASATFNLGYTADYVIENPPKFSERLTLPIDSSSVPVMTAAAASSAAAGFGASEHVTGDFDLSWVFEDNAISFALANSQAQYMDASGKDLQSLASAKVVRLADGGAADNSAVAQLVRSLQLNSQNPANSLEIVAFDNVTDISDPGNGGAKVGIDIASLFGFSDPLCVNLKLTKYCITTPSLQIFDAKPLQHTKAKWTYQDGNNYLVYTRYKATTKANPELGIAGGVTVILHSFTAAYPSAATAPADGDSDFDAYDNMFKFIQDGLSANSGEGLKHLETALGL